MTGELRVSFEDYLADCAPEPSLSRSTIMDLLYKSPRHAWFNHPRLCLPEGEAVEEDDAEEPKYDIGKTAHSLFLEGIDVARCIMADDWRKKETKALRSVARQEGKIPLLAQQYAEVTAMVHAANVAITRFWETNNLPGAFREGEAELSYLWEEKGTWFRTRTDWVSADRKMILDYKTTGQSANPEDFVRSVIGNGYDVQEALYKRGVSKVCGTRPTFTFMVQETYPPYLCSFIELDLQFQDMGESKVRKGIEIWKRCMATGEWPGYSDRIYTVEAPAWALGSWEMRKGLYELHV